MASPADSIREKLDDGRLPLRDPVATWAGYGQGNPCRGCDQPIRPAQVEYEVDVGADETYRLHAGCFALWEAERRRRRHSGDGGRG